MSLAFASFGPRGFTPVPGANRWWSGDPESLPYFDPAVGHPMIVMIRRLFTPDQCAVLIDAANRLPTRHDDNHFWDQRVQTLDHLPPEEHRVRALMQQARLLIQLELIGQVRPPRRLWGDTAQLVRWDVGQSLDAHTDNLEPDGTPNATPHRAASAVVYLNDDYEGGETFFPGFGLKVRPEPGLAIAFGAGPSHVHGVTELRRGRRYMMAAWYTLDPAERDPAQCGVYG